MSTNKYWNIHMQKSNIKELWKALYVHTNKFGIYTSLSTGQNVTNLDNWKQRLI